MYLLHLDTGLRAAVGQLVSGARLLTGVVGLSSQNACERRWSTAMAELLRALRRGFAVRGAAAVSRPMRKRQ